MIGGGLTAAYFTATGLIANYGCKKASDFTDELITTFLGSKIGISGSINMDMMLGDGMTLPVAGKNLLMPINVDLDENLINLLKSIEYGCTPAVWLGGLSLLLLASAATGGAIIAYNHFHKKDEVVAIEAPQEVDDRSDLSARLVMNQV